jgi:putative ABC transport system permease protein
MWRNYLTTGLRALWSSKTYAFINIFGLALGLAACLTLFIYILYETSYDRWLPEHERVFQVQTFGVDPETGERLDQQAVTQPIGASLAAYFPEIEAVSKFESDNAALLIGGRALPAQDAYAADEAFFEILQLPFIRGARTGALRTTDSVAVSRSEAMRLFGSIDVVGRTLTMARGGERYDLRVTGVFEDLPRNSHTDFALVRRFNAAEEAEDCPWGCVSGSTYLKLRPGADAGAVNARMDAWKRANVPESVFGGYRLRDRFDWRLTNVADVHLGPAQGGVRPGNDMRTIATFGIVALLILGIACVNFVNLATARASRRAREVAVRKVLGARRGQLVAQFMGESLLLVSVAMLIALALVEVTLPAFSSFLDADLQVTYLGAGGVAWPVAVLTLAVGLAGGLYPAFYLSRYKPAAVLKANRSAADTPGSNRLRQGLVVAQFAVSIGLIICTAIVYQQTVFARTNDPGYQRDGLLIIDGLREPEVAQARERLAREIGRIDGVEAVAGTAIVPGTDRTLLANLRLPGRAAPVELGWYSVEPGFFETMRMEVVAGRALSRAQAADNVALDPAASDEANEAAARDYARRGFNIVVNETAARRLGFATPAAAVGQQAAVPAFGDDVGLAPVTIVGVVRDTRFRSMREPLEPIAYYDLGAYAWLAVRLRTDDPSGVRRQIEQAWQRVLPSVPFEAEFADEKLASLYDGDAARGQTFAGFALIAIVIACLGLFGLAAFTAERRTKEIGIRKVFGATTRDIVQLLAWQFSKPVILANIIAWPAAWWAMRDWLNGFDARIPLGPGPFLLAGLIALAIAIGTVAGHAIKVARSNPIHALRYE